VAVGVVAVVAATAVGCGAGHKGTVPLFNAETTVACLAKLPAYRSTVTTDFSKFFIFVPRGDYSERGAVLRVDFFPAAVTSQTHFFASEQAARLYDIAIRKQMKRVGLEGIDRRLQRVRNAVIIWSGDQTDRFVHILLTCLED
jgi:hypothetical protein